MRNMNHHGWLTYKRINRKKKYKTMERGQFVSKNKRFNCSIEHYLKCCYPKRNHINLSKTPKANWLISNTQWYANDSRRRCKKISLITYNNAVKIIGMTILSRKVRHPFRKHMWGYDGEELIIEGSKSSFKLDLFRIIGMILNKPNLNELLLPLIVTDFWWFIIGSKSKRKCLNVLPTFFDSYWIYLGVLLLTIFL